MAPGVNIKHKTCQQTAQKAYHGLQVDRNDFGLIRALAWPVMSMMRIKAHEQPDVLELMSEHLRPAAWRGTQIHSRLDPVEQAKLLVQVQELVCRSSPVPCRLPKAVVHVPVVDRRFRRGHDGETSTMSLSGVKGRVERRL